MDLSEYNIFSAELRSKGFVYVPSAEVFWPSRYVVEVLRELAASERAVLGFDIIAIEADFKPCLHGTSAYSLEKESAGRSWRDCVDISLQLALRDLDHVKALSGVDPLCNDVYYAVVAADQVEYAKLILSPNTIWVTGVDR